LKEFFNGGGNDTRHINSHLEIELRDQLAALDSAADIADLAHKRRRFHSCQDYFGVPNKIGAH